MSTKTTKAGTTRKPASKTSAKKAAKAKRPARAGKPKTEAPAKAAAPQAEKPQRPRDPRLPPAGTEIVRPYKGHDVRVTVHEDGALAQWSESREDFDRLAAELVEERDVGRAQDLLNAFAHDTRLAAAHEFDARRVLLDVLADSSRAPSARDLAY